MRWAVSPFWKMPERPSKPLVELSPVWRTASLVAAGMLAAGVLLDAGGLATCGFSPERFHAEQDRANAAMSQTMSDWFGWEAPGEPASAGPANPASANEPGEPTDPSAPAAPADPSAPGC